jgi:hypothetical protein
MMHNGSMNVNERPRLALFARWHHKDHATMKMDKGGIPSSGFGRPEIVSGAQEIAYSLYECYIQIFIGRPNRERRWYSQRRELVEVLER